MPWRGRHGSAVRQRFGSFWKRMWFIFSSMRFHRWKNHAASRPRRPPAPPKESDSTGCTPRQHGVRSGDHDPTITIVWGGAGGARRRSVSLRFILEILGISIRNSRRILKNAGQWGFTFDNGTFLKKIFSLISFNKSAVIKGKTPLPRVFQNTP